MSVSYKTFCVIPALAVAVQCFWVAPGAWANPYSAVAERNIFGLKDPPPPPAEPEPEPEPPPNVKVVGITTLMGIPRALVKVQVPAKPQQPAKEDSYIMVAGGPAQGGVEVLEIKDSNDLKDVKVKIRVGGKESWMALDKDTPKAAPAVAAAAGGNPAQVAAAQAAAQKLAAARAAAAAANPGANPGNGIPTRPVRTAQGGPANAMGYAGGVPGYTPGAALQTGTTQQKRQAMVHDYGLSREEQVILIEANREMTIEDVALGDMPPLPPTEMTPPELDPTAPPEMDPMDPNAPGIPGF